MLQSKPYFQMALQHVQRCDDNHAPLCRGISHFEIEICTRICVQMEQNVHRKGCLANVYGSKMSSMDGLLIVIGSQMVNCMKV